MNIKNEVDCIRVGAPYDEPAFEALCREMSIWSTAQAALCAVFWRKGGADMAEAIGAGGVSVLVPVADRTQRQDAEVWSRYVASMVEAYLESNPAADKREAAIAGIISRRLWALSDRAQRQAGQEPSRAYCNNCVAVTACDLRNNAKDCADLCCSVCHSVLATFHELEKATSPVPAMTEAVQAQAVKPADGPLIDEGTIP